MEKKLNGKSAKTDKKVLKPHLFQKGNDPRRNLEGRPAGALSFSTKWFAFMERIAKENGVSTSELDHKMMTVAFKQMQDGKFPYWKDVNDRLYGQATQKHEIEGELVIDNYNWDNYGNNNNIPPTPVDKNTSRKQGKVEGDSSS